MKKLKYTLIILASVFVTSCTNLVEEQLDPDGVISENVYKKLSNVEQVVLSTYSALPLGANLYSQALITDELKFNQQNIGSGKEVHSWTFTADQAEFYSVWAGAYGSISIANRVILNIDQAEVLNADDQKLKDQLLGEALAVRAFNHFMLVKLFSPKYSPTALGVPYVTGDDIYAQPSRPTMAETYSSIIKDCNDAYPLLVNSDSKIRFNQAAVKTLLAYVALEMNDFDAAITYADQALAFNSTLADTLPNFRALWADTNDSEIIFEQKNILGSASAAAGTYFTTKHISNGGLIQWSPGTELYKAYNSSDFRKSVYFSGTSSDLSSFFVNKYPGPTTANFGISDIKVFRVADLYLIKAEANARKTTPDLAAAFTNYAAVRTARNAGTSVMFTSATDAIDKILEERRREFAFEGSRYTDLKRNGRQITRVGLDIYILNPIPTLTDINRYTYPIPTHEMQANSNIQQNAGY